MNTPQRRWFATVPVILMIPLILQGQALVSSGGVTAFRELVRKSFGPDYRLANGIQYYDHYFQTKGIPYFATNRFMDGAITLKDKSFENIGIRYDLVSQQVEVEFDNLHGSTTWILPPADYVRGFLMGGLRFEKRSVANGPRRFYQVIGTDDFACYVYWHKKLLPLQNNRHNDQGYIYVFSGVKTECYLERNGKPEVFHNRKSLMRLFPEEFRRPVWRIIKQNGFNIKRATPLEFETVMNSISEEINTGEAR